MARSWRTARSLQTLDREIDRRWPGRPTGADGFIGDQDHQARTSDHNAWVLPPKGGVVTAGDWTDFVIDGKEMNVVLAEHLRRSRDPRIKYVICNGRMFSSYATSRFPAWTWRPYSGPNGHFKHLHLSVQAASGLFDSTAPWGLLGPVPAPRLPQEDIVTPQDKADIINGVTANVLAKLQPGGGEALGVEQDRVRRTLRKIAAKVGVELDPATDA